MKNLAEKLIIASEKAANIARLCRRNDHLFQLLIEEKGESEKNPRFVQDFKTLADVLIQEMIKKEVGAEFPELLTFIQGEESNEFTNPSGEKLIVQIKNSQSDTIQLLQKVLDGNTEAAQALVEEIYKDVQLNDINLQQPLIEVNEVDNLGIWIDPIDSTAEYIRGTFSEHPAKSGLACATVLIGVYSMISGEPVFGVINQPFADAHGNGKCYINTSSVITDYPLEKIKVTISPSEDVSIKERLTDGDCDLFEAAGAGFKILLVIDGTVDAYVVSKPTTFSWDTCGPHAILKSMGGGICDFQQIIQCGSVNEISYKSLEQNKLNECCNKGGLIAYRNQKVLQKLMKILRKDKCML